jgi:hypothetical protein
MGVEIYSNVNRIMDFYPKNETLAGRLPMRPSEEGESAQMKKLYVRISPNSHPGATRWGSFMHFSPQILPK